MKPAGKIAKVCLFTLLLIEAGCEPAPPRPPGPFTVDGNVPNNLAVYTHYVPARIDISPLTEFVTVDGAPEASKIKVYVSLLDSFGCQMKGPGRFRFEIYNHVPRSAEHKGKRLAIWPDVDLTNPTDNNNYWRDFFRAYEFDLDFSPQSGRSYVLEATCFCPNGKRLTAEFDLKYVK